MHAVTAEHVAAGQPGRRVVAGECVFATFAVMVYFGIHLGFNSVANPDNNPAPDAMATVNQAVVLLGGLIVVLRHRTAWLAGWADVWPFLGLLSLAIASSLWSQSPDASLRRSLTLATLITFATYAHAVLGTRLICRIEVAAMWIVAIASFAVAVLVPRSGFDIADYAGAVRGIFTQKNTLGDAMLLGLLARSYVVVDRRKIVAGDLACAALALGTCVLAQATTSFLLCSFVIGATVFTLLVLDGGVVASFVVLTVVMAVCLGLWAMVAAQADVFGLVGKDSTLTGRAQIWVAVRAAMIGHEILGFGYSAFWLPTAHASNDVWAAIGWIAPSAHSGYLETRLELGIVGLMVVATLAAATLLTAIAAAWAGCPAPAASAAILLMVTATVNYDESSLPHPDAHLLQWIIMFAACTRAWRVRRGADARAPDRFDMGPRTTRPDVDVIVISKS